MFGGARRIAQASSLYSEWMYDSGISEFGWRLWMLGKWPGCRPLNLLIAQRQRSMAWHSGIRPPPIDIMHFDFDGDTRRLDAISPQLNATSVDYEGFKRRGAKLLLYTGVSDPIFSAADLARYYSAVSGANGGAESTGRFARLYLVPGMNHCGGGKATDQFDTLAALESWVEKGKAPDRIIARGARRFPDARGRCAFIPWWRDTGFRRCRVWPKASPASRESGYDAPFIEPARFKRLRNSRNAFAAIMGAACGISSPLTGHEAAASPNSLRGQNWDSIKGLPRNWSGVWAPSRPAAPPRGATGGVAGFVFGGDVPLKPKYAAMRDERMAAVRGDRGRDKIPLSNSGLCSAQRHAREHGSGRARISFFAGARDDCAREFGGPQNMDRRPPACPR